MNCKYVKMLATVILALLGVSGLLFPASSYAKEKAKPKPAGKSTGASKSKGKGKSATKAQDAAKEAEAAELQKRTWALRDHFKFPQGKTTFRYAVETCEWSVELDPKQTLIDNASFQITLADGTTLDAASLGKAENAREKFTNELGSGTAYVNTFPSKDGVLVRHSISMYTDRLFFLIGIGIGNNSQKPIEVAKITLASFGAAGISGLSPDTKFSSRHLQWRGGSPAFSTDGPSLLSILEDRAKGLTFSFGILPRGFGNSSVNLSASGGKWVGDITCVCDPPIRVEPGQKIETDSVWCTLAMPATASIDENYAWSLSRLPHPGAKELPRAWFTTQKGSSQADLLAAAEAWNGIVKQALVPSGWEGRPGSLEGSTPNFPKDMGKLAKQLSAAGAEPGIVVDPLMASGGNSKCVAKSGDGTTWFNLSEPDARKQAVEGMKKVVGWGYRFFVVTPSTIPNEVLSQFNMDRVQADSAAVSVMAEAAGTLPVFSSSACSLKASQDAWFQAAAAVNRLRGFDVPCGPVRFDIGGLQSLDENCLTALKLMAGTIEFTGTPKGQIGSQIARALSQKNAGCSPVDASSDVPRLWKTTVYGDEDLRGCGLLALPGAQAWTLEDLGLGPLADALVWRAADGKPVDMSKGSVTPENAITVYGITPKPTHPVVMGASTGFDLLLGDMKSVAWDEAKGVLSGAFSGSNTDRATAYVAVPEGWTLASGRANDQNVSRKGATEAIEFSVAPGVPTKFEFKFSKK